MTSSNSMLRKFFGPKMAAFQVVSGTHLRQCRSKTAKTGAWTTSSSTDPGPLPKLSTPLMYVWLWCFEKSLHVKSFRLRLLSGFLRHQRGCPGLPAPGSTSTNCE